MVPGSVLSVVRLLSVTSVWVVGMQGDNVNKGRKELLENIVKELFYKED